MSVFGIQNVFEKRVMFRLVSKSFSNRILTRIFDVWDFKLVVFRMEGIAKNRLCMFGFWMPWEPFF